jgi:hypothetical protein
MYGLKCVENPITFVEENFFRQEKCGGLATSTLGFWFNFYKLMNNWSYWMGITAVAVIEFVAEKQDK